MSGQNKERHKKVIIIDDERNISEGLETMVTFCTDEVKVVGKAHGVNEGLKLIESSRPDIVLLDIRMQDGTGFDLLKRLKNISFKIIFITAYGDFAIKAFEYNAIDYLLKPVDLDLLKNALEKAMQRIDLEVQSKQLENLLLMLSEGISATKRIALRTADSIHLVDIDEIIRCEAKRNYTEFLLKGKKPILVSKTMKEFESVLEKNQFFRIHQSHLINMQYLERYDKKDGGSVVMKDGTVLPVSNRKREEMFLYLEGMVK